MAINKEIARLLNDLQNTNVPEFPIAELARIGEPAIQPLLSQITRQTGEATISRAKQALILMGDRAVPRLIHYLHSGDLITRAAAAAILAAIGSPEGLEALRFELERDVAHLRQPWWRDPPGRRFAFRYSLVAALMVLVALLPSNSLEAPKILVGILALLAMAYYGLNIARQSRAGFRHVALLEIVRLDDPKIVNLLAPLALDSSNDVRWAAETGLRKLLPQVTPEQLDPQAIDSLLKLLLTASDDIALPALNLMSQIDEERVLERISTIANAEVANYSIPLRRAARQALPALRKRIQAKRDGAALLRPADSMDNLLRPAASRESETVTLLRPTGNPD